MIDLYKQPKHLVGLLMVVILSLFPIIGSSGCERRNSAMSRQEKSEGQKERAGIIDQAKAENQNQQTAENNNFSPNVLIVIENNKDVFLHIFIAADGTINRRGSVNESFTAPNDERYKALVIGHSDEMLYDQLLRTVTQQYISLNGAHELVDRNRAAYHMFIGIEVDEKKGTRHDYYYGAEGEGPPILIRQFVKKAVALTDDWYKKHGA